MERKAISKKVRFEVFKRDSFKCQYCGRSAPEVILHIDHINPVANGGDNNILNLITSCFDCNMGKKATPLDDNSAVTKQKKELDLLQERREQMDLLIQWRNGLSEINQDKIQYIIKYFNEKCNCTIGEKAQKIVEKICFTYPLEEILNAIDASYYSYFKNGTEEDIQLCFSKIEPVLKNIRRQKEKPYLKDLFYYRAILKNNVRYFTSWEALALMENAYLSKRYTLEELRLLCQKASSWCDFKENFI